MAKKVNELQLLEKEIQRLKQRARQLEQEIDGRIEYLQGNFRSLTMMSMLPGFLAKTGTAATLLELFLENKQVRDSVNKLTNTLFGKISAGVEFLGKKFSRKSSKE
jgi:hypothetical protein